jgi:acyl-CoA thioester hydrolase
MYVHKVQYYETDRMGVVHHSNYVRWMEEARIAFMEEGGWDYGKLEEAGVFSPVLEIRCAYRRPVSFPADVTVEVSVREFSGVRLKLDYRMTADGGTVCEASSEHCFTTAEGRPLRLKKAAPELCAWLEDLAAADTER